MQNHFFGFLLLMIFIVSCSSSARLEKEILKYRENYKEEFNTSESAPLRGEQLDSMQFFTPSDEYIVKAEVQINDKLESFEIKTYSGKTKTYVKFADISFNLRDSTYNLEIYRNTTLMKMPQYKDYLFLPFNDLTNGNETYAGGRYIDLDINDIKNNKITIDFNKAYNPYCAYSSGYNCPVPPISNRLETHILAGEMKYTGAYIYH